MSFCCRFISCLTCEERLSDLADMRKC
uniref:Uncharacterized protein n=1 Tax=Arundo donax TaxID=35708 RepID=A0A0A9HJW6_ARUDO